jgi:hypothetical protein
MYLIFQFELENCDGVAKFKNLLLLLLDQTQKIGLVLKQVIDNLSILLPNYLNSGESWLGKWYFILVQDLLDASVQLDKLLTVDQIHHFVIFNEIKVFEEH